MALPNSMTSGAAAARKSWRQSRWRGIEEVADLIASRGYAVGFYTAGNKTCATIQS